MDEIDPNKTGAITLDAFVEYMLAKRHVKDDDENQKLSHPVFAPKKEEEEKKEEEKKEEEEEPKRGRRRSKAKEKEKAPEDNTPPVPLGLSVLNKSSSILEFYNENAGARIFFFFFSNIQTINNLYFNY